MNSQALLEVMNTKERQEASFRLADATRAMMDIYRYPNGQIPGFIKETKEYKAAMDEFKAANELVERLKKERESFKPSLKITRGAK